MTQIKHITLTKEEVLRILKEKSVHRDGVSISSNCSFLSIISSLQEEMSQGLSNVKSA